MLVHAMILKLVYRLLPSFRVDVDSDVEVEVFLVKIQVCYGVPSKIKLTIWFIGLYI